MRLNITNYNSAGLDEKNKKLFGVGQAEKSAMFHESFPGYQETPLLNLKNLAAYLGVKNIYVKDESGRFGLNAFKGLGGSYALSSYLAKRLGEDLSELSYSRLVSKEVRKKLGQIQFATATDGNHGRGISWAAAMLGYQAKVFMPKGSSVQRYENILAQGSECEITDMYYDDTVVYAFAEATKHGWVMAQDTTIEGYEDEFPTWCMQGYLTMAREALTEMWKKGELPTHIFLQAGAGSMAAAMSVYFVDALSDNPPTIVVMESEKCDCFRRTAKKNDGKLQTVDGDISTIMAGLSVGVPCQVGWDALKCTANAFVSVDDDVSALGCRILGNPIKDDARIVSGESGSVGVGLAYLLLHDENYAEAGKALGLDENSSILCFSTEGDTDSESYRSIVWRP